MKKIHNRGLKWILGLGWASGVKFGGAEIKGLGGISIFHERYI